MYDEPNVVTVTLPLGMALKLLGAAREQFDVATRRLEGCFSDNGRRLPSKRPEYVKALRAEKAAAMELMLDGEQALGAKWCETELEYRT